VFSQHAQFLLETVRTAVMLFDGQMHLVSMNAAAEGLLDLSRKKVRGMTVEQLFPEAANPSATLARAISARQAFVDREMPLQLAGGRQVTVDCTVTPLSELGEGDGMVMELMPLDRHKHLTWAERLLAQNEQARSMVRRLAHEIRTPLGGLRGAAQLLRRELVNPELKEFTTVIIREVDRLQGLTDRMLGPRSVPQLRRINVHEVTERVRALLVAEALEGIKVERDYDPSIPEVQVDPELLIQATLNVARNAVQALEGQSGQITLRTRVHRQMTLQQLRHRLVVRLDICDNGPGIPAHLREAVFYPMVTGRNQGTGLGLSIAQSLVNRHGGLIECSSNSTETTFSILLPVNEEREP
jgi:two-component system nitrogen regulation sensor histidine kinase GlnL